MDGGGRKGGTQFIYIVGIMTGRMLVNFLPGMLEIAEGILAHPPQPRHFCLELFCPLAF